MATIDGTGEKAARRQVLVVSNDRAAVPRWVALLERQGHRVAAVEGGRAAQRRVARKAPDLVVLDFRGRPSSGVAVLDQLRGADEAGPRVLVLSTASATVLRQHVAQFDAMLAQPFDDAQLLQAVDRALASSGRAAMRPALPDGASPA